MSWWRATPTTSRCTARPRAWAGRGSGLAAGGWPRQGIEIGREVLANWVGAAAFQIRPVVARLREILLGSVRLFADETGMPVLDPGRGRSEEGVGRGDG